MPIDEFLPITYELTPDNTLKINVGRMSEEDYALLPDFYREYVQECKESGANGSNFRKFKNNDAEEEFKKDTDKELRKYGNLISSRTKEIRDAIYETFKEHLSDPKVEMAYQIMTQEMITNGFHHGNCNDPRKNLLIEAKICGEGDDVHLEFSITDEGEGFDTKAVEGLGEDNTISFGNGILMTRHYSLSLTYEDEGRKAIFKLSTAHEDEQEEN